MYCRVPGWNSSDFIGKWETMSFSRTCLRSSRLPPVRPEKNGRRIIAWPCGAMQTYEIALAVAYRSYGINKITASKDFAIKH